MTDKRFVLVTGASGGIGRAIAARLARDGFVVGLHYHRHEERAAELAAEIAAQGGQARLLTFDVTDPRACRAAITADVEAHGPWYGVVLNAGITADAAFPALSEDDWQSVINTDLNSFYYVLNPALMPMIGARRGGRIIAISSVSGVMGNRGQVNYSAAKAGLIGAVKALAVELAKRKITVNCVAPGLINTDMAALPEEVKAAALAMIPARRMGEPEEVAALVGYLMSDAAGYVTRQVISINGGMY